MSIELVNIVKKFKNPDAPNQEIVAVKNVNLEVKEGEMVTFLGPSGCGKTTTLRIISGFETPTSGEVWIDDKGRQRKKHKNKHVLQSKLFSKKREVKLLQSINHVKPEGGEKNQRLEMR